MDLALANAGSMLELAGIGSTELGGSFCQLLTGTIPVAPQPLQCKPNTHTKSSNHKV